MLAGDCNASVFHHVIWVSGEATQSSLPAPRNCGQQSRASPTGSNKIDMVFKEGKIAKEVRMNVDKDLGDKEVHTIVGLVDFLRI